MSRWLWHWSPVVAQMTVIFIASSQTVLPSLPGGLTDYTGHFIGYGILGGLAVRGFARGRWSGATPAAAWRALALASCYGITDEFHQSFVPGRMPTVSDWIADTLGAATGVVIAVSVARLMDARRRARGV